jgi:hypothetical protein
LKNLIETEVDTPDGVGLLEQIYITELGYVMARIFLPEKKTWVNRKISSLDSMLENTGITNRGNYRFKKFRTKKKQDGFG